MAKFEIKVKEIRTLILTVDAEDEDDAIEVADAEYFDNIAYYDSRLDIEDTILEFVREV